MAGGLPQQLAATPILTVPVAIERLARGVQKATEGLALTSGPISRQLAALSDEARKALLQPGHGDYEVVPEGQLLPMMRAVQQEASQQGIALSGYIAQLVSAARLLRTEILTTNANNVPKWARQVSRTLEVRWKVISFDP